MTLALPCSTTTLFIIAPTTISTKPAQAHLGVAMRQPSSTDEQK